VNVVNVGGAIGGNAAAVGTSGGTAQLSQSSTSVRGGGARDAGPAAHIVRGADPTLPIGPLAGIAAGGVVGLGQPVQLSDLELNARGGIAGVGPLVQSFENVDVIGR
jgi:hypothetical protein